MFRWGGIGEKKNTRRTFASLVTADYFDVLGVTPAMGRTFTAEEQPGQTAVAALVSYSYWMRQNRDPSTP